MIDHIIIAAVSFGVAMLTFFSGFGLGTLLMPAFALIIHNVEWAIAATALVHLANNLFKLGLVGRHADWSAVLRFGIPAAVMSVIGAILLQRMAAVPPILDYALAGRAFEVTSVKAVVAFLMMVFAVLELAPWASRFAFDARYLPLGGALSGFFGGLSGHQGPLRSAFLIRCGLTKEAFIGTGVVCAVIVDISRVTVYGLSMVGRNLSAVQGHGYEQLILTGMVFAFAGSWIGLRMVRKITLRTIRLCVGVLLMVVALALGAGLV